MAVPFLGSRARKREQILGVDLGAHSAKAVHLQSNGGSYSLLGFAVVERPEDSDSESLSPQQQLAGVLSALGTKLKPTAMAVRASDSILRPTELPLVPLSDMRTMLRLNSKNYLQQDLKDHVFDCYILPQKANAASAAPRAGQKTRVLVGAVKESVIGDRLALMQSAGLQAEALVPELVCPCNAFEVAEPDVFKSEAVALIDLGFGHSSICLLLEGDLMLSRIVPVGGDRLTSGLAEKLGTSYSEAEGIKVGLAHEVQHDLAPLISPLARELRASIDFFEHQHDRTVGKVYVSGGSTRSDSLLETLQSELMVPCVPWSPVATITPNLPPNKMAELEQSAMLLGTAIGAAITAL